MKERITITLDGDLLRTVDSMVDNHKIKNRSHAMELLLTKAIQKKELKRAILLAGGDTHTQEDGKEIPLCMARLQEKPLLEHIMINLHKEGINEIVIVSQNKNMEIIKNYFSNGSEFNVEIIYCEEPVKTGTAGALRVASEYITEPVVVCNTTNLFQIRLQDMFKFHKMNGASTTIALTTDTDPSKYGVVVLNGNKIFDFVEKPKNKIPSNLISAGVYIVNPEVIDLIPEGFSKLEVDLFPKLARDESLVGYVFYGRWMHIESQESLDYAKSHW